MKLNYITRAIVCASALFAGSAFAGPAITINADLPNHGAFANFTDFDWSSKGQILIDSYGITSLSAPGSSDSITLHYRASAVALILGGVSTAPAGMNTTFQYTIVADFTETVTCVGAGGACNLVSISFGSGTWKVYYDSNTVGGPTLADYSALSDATFIDGVSILSGSFGAGSPIISVQGPTNPAAANSIATTLFGSVGVTNLTYVTPTLTGTTATSTLQFGAAQTAGWTRPTDVADTNTRFWAQADGNQSFTTPEPASLALVGLALGVAGIAGSRRKKV